MMYSFKERAQAFENKFIADKELQFKENAYRNRLLGLWAADKLGKSGEAADAYVRDVINSDLEEAGDNDIIHKIMTDFSAANIAISEQQLRTKMEEIYKDISLYLKSGQ